MKLSRFAFFLALITLYTSFRDAAHAQTISAEDVRLKIESALYVGGAQREPIELLGHRIALFSIADSKSFHAASDKPTWIKSYLRSPSGLQSFVGAGGPNGDLLSFISYSLQTINRKEFDQSALERLVSTYVRNNGDLVRQNVAVKLFSRIKDANDRDAKALGEIYADSVQRNGAFPDLKAPLSALASVHPSIFAVVERAYPGTVNPVATYSDLAADLSRNNRNAQDIAAAAMDDLGPAVVAATQDARSASTPERKEKSDDQTTAIQTIQAMIELNDPGAAKTFGAIAGNLLKIANAAQNIELDEAAAAASWTGYGEIFVAAVAIFEALQPQGDDEKTKTILKYEADILSKLNQIDSEIKGVNLMVSELYDWLDRADINNQIGFKTIEDQIYDLQDQLTLSTESLSASLTQARMQGPRQDYRNGLTTMTDPAFRDSALRILSGRNAQYLAQLSHISGLGLDDALTPPFVDRSPWSGVGLTTIATASFERRVGDLGGVLDQLPSGAANLMSVDSANFIGRPNPLAFAWSAQRYVDLARWLPVAGAGPDTTLVQYCEEAKKSEKMAEDARTLAPLFSHRYRKAAKALSEQIDLFLKNELDARLKDTKGNDTQLIEALYWDKKVDSKGLDFLIDYDPAKYINADGRPTIDTDNKAPMILLEAEGRGLVTRLRTYQVENVHRADYDFLPPGTTSPDHRRQLQELIDQGLVNEIAPPPYYGGWYMGYTFDCLVEDDSFYLAKTGEGTSIGGTPGDRIYPNKKYRRCGFESEQKNPPIGGQQNPPADHFTKFVRKTEDDLKVYIKTLESPDAFLGEKPFFEVPLSDDDAKLAQDQISRISDAIRDYSSKWQSDIVRDFALQSSLGGQKDPAKTATAHEQARLGLETLLHLGVSSCPSAPSLISNIANASDDGVAARLPSAATIDDVRHLVDFFAAAAVYPKGDDGGPLNIRDAIGKCSPGPKGLAEVATLLNSVSSAYSDRLPDGCALRFESQEISMPSTRSQE